jgi:DNA polymerase-3 subunit beta
MIKLNVRAEIIAVLKLFAADKDPRNYLCGINLEISPVESRLVATNGHMLGCFRVKSKQPEVSTLLTDIIIPSDVLAAIKPSGMVEIAIGEPEPMANGKGLSGRRPVIITQGGFSSHGVTLPATYPDYRRVIPVKVSGKFAQFDARYLGTLAKAWAILHGKKSLPGVALGFNGPSEGALIDLGDEDFIGVIMPLRNTTNPPKSAPAWVHDRLLQDAPEPAADATDSADGDDGDPAADLV